MYYIITAANARWDIQDAIDWENKREPHLADYFLRDLEYKLTIISRSPYVNAIRYDDVRCAKTNIFQYLIHYTIDDDNKTIIIVRVLHTSRKPIW